MDSASLRAQDSRWGEAVAVSVCALAWLAGRLHPWPFGAAPGALLMASAAWIVTLDETEDVRLAGILAAVGFVAYCLASCLAHNLIGLILIAASAFQWVTGSWYAGIGGGLLGLAAAVALVVRQTTDVDFWLEYMWVTLVSSLFGPGLAMHALVQLQWPPVLNAWLLLAGLPFALFRCFVLFRKPA